MDIVLNDARMHSEIAGHLKVNKLVRRRVIAIHR